MSDDLPSAWRLQSLLLGAGLVPRTMQLADLDALGDEAAELVVFDRGVPGAVAMEVLGRVRAPGGGAVAPALFLSDGGGVATSAPGERRLDAGASDAAIVAAVDELVAGVPSAAPRVMPAIDAIDVTEIVGSRPGVIGYRRRRSSIVGPLAALALLLGGVAGYSAVVASRGAAGATPTAAPAAAAPAELALEAAQATAPAGPRATAATTVTIEPTVAAATRPVGGPVADAAVAAASPVASGAGAAAPPGARSSSPTPLAPEEGSAVALPPGAPLLVPAPAPVGPGAAPPAAETGIEGRVTDASTGHGLPGAVVAYRGPTSGQTTTGGDGRYRVPGLPPGAYEVVAIAPGYAQARNRAGVVTETLTTDNLALSPMAGTSVVPFLTVTDQRSGQPVAAYGYPVRPGDTLRAIAERAGTTVDEILALNRIDDADRLEPGRVLYLPASTFGQK